MEYGINYRLYNSVPLEPHPNQTNAIKISLKNLSLKISAGERPQAARLLRSWVRIPPGAWIFVCCECRVLSGRGLCDEVITRPDESYRLCCVVVCDLETSRIGAPYIYIYIYIYIYNISCLRVKNDWSYTSIPPYALMVYKGNCFISTRSVETARKQLVGLSGM